MYRSKVLGRACCNAAVGNIVICLVKGMWLLEWIIRQVTVSVRGKKAYTLGDPVEFGRSWPELRSSSYPSTSVMGDPQCRN